MPIQIETSPRGRNSLDLLCTTETISLQRFVLPAVSQTKVPSDVSSQQRYNLSSQIFDEEASGGIVVYGYANRSVTSPQPYAAEDIIIVRKACIPFHSFADLLQLSDAVCHSACAAFVEMMHHDAGVRTVVAGGLPKVGSMQVPSGSRGAEAYSSLDLDADFDVAVSINASTAAVLPNRDVEFYVSYAGFNIKDAIREGSDTPLQFLYEAADCRIYYTARTVYNYLNLWNYVVDAIWRNPSLCVSDSTSPNSNQAQKDSSKATSTSLGSMILRGFQWNGKPAEPEGGKPSDKRSIYTRENSLRHDSSELNFLVKDDLFDPSVCQKCPRGFVCPAIPLCEISGGPVKTQNQCKRACSSRSPCGKGFLCNLTDNVNGFCETPRAIKVIRLCQDRADSSFQDLEEHPPVGFNVPHLPYSRSRFGSSSSYRYAAPAIRPGGR